MTGQSVMTGPSVLIVPEDDRQFRQIGKAIQDVGVARVSDARPDEAVHWLNLNDCHACVISYEQPGKRTGLELLLDIRQHRPDLPVVMVSRSGSEKVAVAAFHAGVVDYVPIGRGYEIAVASLISQIKVSNRLNEIMPAQLIPAGVDERLMQLSYQNKLRAIGRHIDLYSFRRINILEVAGGFVVRATASNGRDTETLEFADQHFPQLLAHCATSRGEGERRPAASLLLPTGYEDFLRVIGHRLDQHSAEAITLSELDELAVVGAVGRVDEYGVTRYGPLQWLLRKPDIERLLDEAYRRRELPEPTEARKPGVLRRITG